ncbi:MAG: phospholipase D-like domain-containing protein [Ilumatobacteraceae bacterium]
MDPVLTAIRERTEADVTVKILLDHRHASYENTQKRLNEHAPACEVLVWPDDQRQIDGGRMAALHAKCAVADGQRAFVSSANLAGYAMDHNLEVGILVRGGEIPRGLERHLDALQSSGGIVHA